MTEQEFDFVRALVLDRSAVALDATKRYLVESRLGPVARASGCDSISALIARARSRPADETLTQIVEAMLTSETSFFRDHHPFEALRTKILPDLIERRRGERRLRIWCAAASTGQEPYSVAMLVRESFPQLLGWDLSILATDLSRPALDRTRAGWYSQIEVNRGLPANLLVKYFHQRGTTWQLADEVRRMVTIETLNLVAPWPSLPRQDLILMRNVMIYFEVEVKKSILGKIARLLRPDGYLLLGGAETTFNLDDSFRRVEPTKSGFYQMVNAT